MRAAHEVGLKSNATMLYGHVETPEELADHMVRLRELQDDTGGFNAFIPLSFQPANTGLSELPGPTGFDDLKMLAVGRLVLDNFRHVKAFWINVGLKLAQVSLAFGVNDLDGTVVEEKISHAAGVDTGQELSKAELVRVIRAAGRVPVERDTLYNVVRRYDDDGRRRLSRAAATGRPGAACASGASSSSTASRSTTTSRGSSPRAAWAPTIVEGYPAALNEMLVDGAIDVALSSSIAFARNADELVLLPQVSISSFGAVDSIQLFTRTPLRGGPPRRAHGEERDLHLPAQGALPGVGHRARVRAARGSALRGARRTSTRCCSSATRRCTCCASRSTRTTSTSARSGRASPACRWCTPSAPRAATSSDARPEAAAAVGAALLASRDACARSPAETAAAAAQLYDFSQRYLMDYFDKLKFEFTPEYRAGLQEFYRRAAAIGELERVPDLEHGVRCG